MSGEHFSVNGERLVERIERMAQIGAIDGGGVNRLALGEADAEARSLLIDWMQALGMSVRVDAIGNIIGTRNGTADLSPAMTGSHIDSVATGGRYDGTLGVLAGLELVESLNEHNISTLRPICVASFTNEEGARFAPDMLGSAVYQGSLALDDALASQDRDGKCVGDCLEAIGFRGDGEVPGPIPHAFAELHIEQGPRLEHESIEIGAVTSVQGISWTEYVIDGVSNHAGTTPMSMRRDAGFAAAQLAVRAREISLELGDPQVATVGVMDLEPNLVNVVARRATITVDLRNVAETKLQKAEALMRQAVADIERTEGVRITSRVLARFEPVNFSRRVVDLVAHWAHQLGHSVVTMPSGAGHDAQMFAPVCQTAMVFVPSEGGISHNVREFTPPHQIQAGANVLANVMLTLANEMN